MLSANHKNKKFKTVGAACTGCSAATEIEPLFHCLVVLQLTGMFVIAVSACLLVLLYFTSNFGIEMIS